MNLIDAGVAHYNRGAYETALRCFEQAAKSEPGNADLMLFAARCRQMLGRPSAVSTLERAVAAAKDSPESLMRAADLALELGDAGRARRLGARAAKLDPALAVRLTRFKPVPASDRREEELRDAVQAARQALRLGRRAAAARAAARALTLDPDCAAALTARGACLVLGGRGKDAVADLKRAARLDPREAEPHVWLAEAAWRGGTVAAALVKAEDALRLKNENFAAHLLRALCLWRRQELGWKEEWSWVSYNSPVPLSAATPADPEPELLALLKKMQGNRSHPATCVVKGKLVSRQAPETFREGTREKARCAQECVRAGRPSAAFKVFKQLLAQERDRLSRALLFCYRGETNLWLGRLTAAAADFKSALALETETRWAYVGLCGVETLRGRPEAALGWAAEAQKRSATGVLTWRGECLRRSGRAAEALPELERAAAVSPERVSAWINLALAQGALGRPGECKRLLARCRRLAPALLAAAGKGTPQKILERALALLRGNRSSWLDVWFAADGSVRRLRGEARVG